MTNNNPYNNSPIGDSSSSNNNGDNSAVQDNIYGDAYSYNAYRSGNHDNANSPYNEDPNTLPTRPGTGRGMFGEAVRFGFAATFRNPLLFIGGTALLLVLAGSLSFLFTVFNGPSSTFFLQTGESTPTSTSTTENLATFIYYVAALLFIPLAYNLALRSLRFRKPGIKDLVTGVNYFPTIGAYLLSSALTFTVLLPSAIFVAMFISANLIGHSDTETIKYSTGLILVTALIAVLFIVINLFISIMLWNFPWLVADRREKFFPALLQSAKLGFKHFFPLLGFSIIQSLLNIAGMMLCFVGLFVTLPASILASAYFFRGLVGGDVPANN